MVKEPPGTEFFEPGVLEEILKQSSAKPGSILSDEMKALIGKKTGMTEEELKEYDHPTDQRVSFDYLPLGYGGRLIRILRNKLPENHIFRFLLSPYYTIKEYIEEQKYYIPWLNIPWLKENPNFRSSHDPKPSRTYEFFARAYQRLRG